MADGVVPVQIDGKVGIKRVGEIEPAPRDSGRAEPDPDHNEGNECELAIVVSVSKGVTAISEGDVIFVCHGCCEWAPKIDDVYIISGWDVVAKASK